jgi:hypothetical protein
MSVTTLESPLIFPKSRTPLVASQIKAAARVLESEGELLPMTWLALFTREA